LNKSKGLSVDYAANWQEMVEETYGIPATNSSADFRHMGDLAAQLMTKQLGHLNAPAT